MKFSLLLVFSLFSSFLLAQEYSYKSAGKTYKFYLQKDLVAEFPQQKINSTKFKTKKLLSKKGGVSFYKVDASSFKKNIKAVTVSEDAQPVFSSSESGGTLRTLPGGVIVVFKKEMSPSELEAWAQRFNVTIEKKTNLINSWLIKTNPGINALEIANHLSTSEEVKIVEPNWWVQSTLK